VGRAGKAVYQQQGGGGVVTRLTVEDADTVGVDELVADRDMHDR
jgi:hypothetical protein